MRTERICGLLHWFRKYIKKICSCCVILLEILRKRRQEMSKEPRFFFLLKKGSFYIPTTDFKQHIQCFTFPGRRRGWSYVKLWPRWVTVANIYFFIGGFPAAVFSKRALTLWCQYLLLQNSTSWSPHWMYPYVTNFLILCIPAGAFPPSTSSSFPQPSLSPRSSASPFPFRK